MHLMDTLYLEDSAILENYDEEHYSEEQLNKNKRDIYDYNVPKDSSNSYREVK